MLQPLQAMRAPLSNFLVLSIALIVSCSSNIEMVKLKDAPPGSGTEKVEFYANGEQVRRPYEELALITVDDAGNGYSDEKLNKALQDKAHSIHADAVIISNREMQTTYERRPVSGFAGRMGGDITTVHRIDKKVLTGIAIAYNR